MKHVQGKRILLAAVSASLFAACTSTGVGQVGGAKPSNSGYASVGGAGRFGNENTVGAAISTVKSHGSETRMGSTAIRLPERPLYEIAAFAYAYPPECGGHEFSVYESGDMQILEYRYSSENGDSYEIRDYVNGPSPFIKAGLWGAYDHTADSVASMRPQYQARGSSLIRGVYSQGLVADLPTATRESLGRAYSKALDEANACRTTLANLDKG
jgi:hypothetical protein